MQLRPFSPGGLQGNITFLFVVLSATKDLSWFHGYAFNPPALFKHSLGPSALAGFRATWFFMAPGMGALQNFF